MTSGNPGRMPALGPYPAHPSRPPRPAAEAPELSDLRATAHSPLTRIPARRIGREDDHLERDIESVVIDFA